jgi:translation initiation factor 1
MKTGDKSGGLVYSTDGGRMCPACREPVGTCVCGQKKPAHSADGVVRVSRETKGRNGKIVTVVRGLALDDAALMLIAKELKTACGSGGTVKDGVIEVQGEHCERVIEILARRFGNVKRAGG